MAAQMMGRSLALESLALRDLGRPPQQSRASGGPHESLLPAGPARMSQHPAHVAVAMAWVGQGARPSWMSGLPGHLMSMQVDVSLAGCRGLPSCALASAPMCVLVSYDLVACSQLTVLPQLSPQPGTEAPSESWPVPGHLGDTHAST